MIVLVIEDAGAGERNSFGFFVMKDRCGKLHFCCEEWIMRTDDLRGVLDWKTTDAVAWTDWSPDDALSPALLTDVERAGLRSCVTGALDTDKLQWVWRGEPERT